MWGWAPSGFDAGREGSAGQAPWFAGWACCATMERKKTTTGVFHAACCTALPPGLASFVGGREQAKVSEGGAGCMLTTPTGPSGESPVAELGACTTEHRACYEPQGCAVVGGCGFAVDVTARGASCLKCAPCKAVELPRTAAWSQREGVTKAQGVHSGGWDELRRAGLMPQPQHPLKPRVVP